MAFRTAQIADCLGMSVIAICKMLQTGQIKGRKHADGRHWLIEKEDIARFIRFDDHYLRRFIDQQDKVRNKDAYSIILRELNKIQ